MFKMINLLAYIFVYVRHYICGKSLINFKSQEIFPLGTIENMLLSYRLFINKAYSLVFVRNAIFMATEITKQVKCI